MNELERQAARMLKKASIKYERVYQYAGCSDVCGRMPRVIVCIEGKIPICFHLEELKDAIEDGSLVEQ